MWVSQIQNLINISANLALGDYTVFTMLSHLSSPCAAMSDTRVSLALLNTNLIGAGAGYSYVISGPTHQCYENITMMQVLPNFQLLSPAGNLFV